MILPCSRACPRAALSFCRPSPSPERVCSLPRARLSSVGQSARAHHRPRVHGPRSIRAVVTAMSILMRPWSEAPVYEPFRRRRTTAAIFVLSWLALFGLIGFQLATQCVRPLTSVAHMQGPAEGIQLDLALIVGDGQRHDQLHAQHARRRLVGLHAAEGSPAMDRGGHRGERRSRRRAPVLQRPAIALRHRIGVVDLLLHRARFLLCAPRRHDMR